MKQLLATAVFLTVIALPAAAQSGEGHYVAQGSDPPWTLRNDGRVIRFGMPGRTPVVAVAGRPVRTPTGMLWNTRQIRVSVQQARCVGSDRGSDRFYRDTVTATVHGRTYHGCGGPSTAAPQQAMILNGDWSIQAINGRQVTRGQPPTLSFDNGSVSGDSSCNRFSGRFSFARGLLATNNLAVTKRACLQRDRQEQERAILQLLGEQIRVSQNRPGILTLAGSRDQSLTLVRRGSR